MEIERKFTIKKLPDLNNYPFVNISQAYISTEPVIRARKKNNDYILTVKGEGLMCREEHELSLTKTSFEHLLSKADGNIISKDRYLIPDGKYTIELDVFKGALEGLIIAEVEFPSVEEANLYNPKDWFLKDVTSDGRYHNSCLCTMDTNSIKDLISQSI